MADIKLSDSGLRVLESRYLKKEGEREALETPENLFRRVAANIAEASANYDEDPVADKENFFRVMADLDFLPNSPTLMNAGNELQQLAACFVIPIEDTMEGIFDAVKSAALIHKSGGGTGFSFSRLRPKNDRVLSTGGVASGPISFMEVFDSATNTIKQGGKRRGANMGILNVDHPDILEFISCKEENDRLNNFNISVGLTEKFMEAVAEGRDYPLINPQTKEETGRLNAREVFDRIVKMAHKNGEPGIIFLDRINAANPTPELGKIESTNPCGEQPLLPFEACNLGSINLAHMVKKTHHGPAVDYDRLREVTRISVRFLDNVIDMNNYPLPQIRDMALGNRKIGLGVMGWADMLIKLRIPYGSPESLGLAEEIMGFIHRESEKVSEELAEKRGTFPNFPASVFKKPRRNATLTTIAPTGSISIIANASSGIEPLFALSYQRHVLDSTLTEVHPLFEEVAREEGFYSPEIVARVSQGDALEEIEEIPDHIKDIFVTAHDIDPERHIKTQAAFQKFVDNAVSKTVNFCNEATPQDVAMVFQLAYELKCKGVTIYRDGSRDSQVLTTGKTDDKPKSKRPRPRVTVGTTTKTEIGCGKLYITINSDNDGICEVFTSTGRGGGCHSQSEATSRLISLSLRAGVPPKEIIHQLRGIRCAAALKRKGVSNTSCPDAIGRAIEEYLEYVETNKNLQQDVINRHQDNGESQPDIFATNGSYVCPDCGMEVEHEGGCVLCRNCGFSRCG